MNLSDSSLLTVVFLSNMGGRRNCIKKKVLVEDDDQKYNYVKVTERSSLFIGQRETGSRYT